MAMLILIAICCLAATATAAKPTQLTAQQLRNDTGFNEAVKWAIFEVNFDQRKHYNRLVVIERVSATREVKSRSETEYNMVIRVKESVCLSVYNGGPSTAAACPVSPSTTAAVLSCDVYALRTTRGDMPFVVGTSCYKEQTIS